MPSCVVVLVEVNLRLETMRSSINGNSNNDIECNAPPTIDMKKIIHLSPVGLPTRNKCFSFSSTYCPAGVVEVANRAILHHVPYRP
jgi:hypothetical protein